MLKAYTPKSLFYLNESIGDVRGLGLVNKLIINILGKCEGREIIRARNLISSLPLEMRVENLMYYMR